MQRKRSSPAYGGFGLKSSTEQPEVGESGNLAKRERARLRRSINRFLDTVPSDQGIAALYAGLAEHHLVVERLDRLLSESRRRPAGGSGVA